MNFELRGRGYNEMRWVQETRREERASSATNHFLLIIMDQTPSAGPILAQTQYTAHIYQDSQINGTNTNSHTLHLNACYFIHVIF